MSDYDFARVKKFSCINSIFMDETEIIYEINNLWYTYTDTN